MKPLPDTRSLLLEQLESRCLLAGGVFLFSAAAESGATGAPHDTASSPPRPAELRTVASERSDSAPPQNLRGGPRNESGGPRNDRIFLRRDLPSANQTAASVVVLVAEIDTAPSAQSNRLPLAATQPPTNQSSSNSVASPKSNGNASPSAAVDLLADAADTSADAQRDALLTANANVPQLDVAEPSSSTAVDSVAPVAAVVTNDQDVGGSIRSNQPDLESESSTTNSIDLGVSADAEDPLIDSFPWQSHRPLQPEASDSASAWELGEDTLRSLKAVAEPTGEATDQDAIVALDAIVATWFDGPGGLIELVGERVPLLHTEAIDQIVAVELDAGLGLHRSLDLLAVTDAQPGEDDLRAAILNAIARADHPVVAPVRAEAPTRASALTYPGIALVVGSLAMAARRRQANARAVEPENE